MLMGATVLNRLITEVRGFVAIHNGRYSKVWQQRDSERRMALIYMHKIIRSPIYFTSKLPKRSSDLAHLPHVFGKCEPGIQQIGSKPSTHRLDDCMVRMLHIRSKRPMFQIRLAHTDDVFIDSMPAL